MDELKSNGEYCNLFPFQILELLNPNEAIILSFLYGYCRLNKNERGREEVIITQNVISVKTHINLRTVKRVLISLEEKGHLIVEKITTENNVLKYTKYKVSENIKKYYTCFENKEQDLDDNLTPTSDNLTPSSDNLSPIKNKALD